MTLAQNGNPGYLTGIELMISPSGQSFTEVNSCYLTGTMSTSGALVYVFPSLRNDAGTGSVTGSGATAFPTSLWDPPGTWENSQCVLSANQSTASQGGTYPFNTMQIRPSFRYKTPYVGLHNVWGKVNNGAGYSSGWQPATSLLTVLP